MNVALAIYAIGVLVGVLVMRDPLVPRLVTAAFWPIGPIAGLLIVCGLLLVSVVLWPVTMLVGATLIGAAIYLIG